MAKVLQKGDKHPKKPWVGKKLDCDACHCEFILEHSDKVDYHADQRDGDYYSTNCPNQSCKKPITFML